jgi:hypothetical protein
MNNAKFLIIETNRELLTTRTQNEGLYYMFSSLLGHINMSTNNYHFSMNTTIGGTLKVLGCVT